jgi:hypothetical protein
MLNKKMDKKNITIVALSAIVIVLALGISLLIMHNIKVNRELKNSTRVIDVNKTYTGKVTRIEDGIVYFMPEGEKEEDSTVTNFDKLQVGDEITYNMTESGAMYNFRTKMYIDDKEYDKDLYEEQETTTTAKVKQDEIYIQTNAVTEKHTDILEYVKGENQKYSKLENNEENKNKAKEYFVSLVDFIFYGGTLNGVTFKELSDSTKVKVIYYTLKIDSIIDKNIPGYKDTLSDSYKNAKNQLIAMYTDYSYDVCLDNPELCNDLKKDTEDLKKSLNITWSIIKDIYNELIKPAGTSSIQKLADWYEVWKNA